MFETKSSVGAAFKGANYRIYNLFKILKTKNPQILKGKLSLKTTEFSGVQLTRTIRGKLKLNVPVARSQAKPKFLTYRALNEFNLLLAKHEHFKYGGCDDIKNYDEESRGDDPILGGVGASIDLANDVDVAGSGHQILENARLSALQKDLEKEMKVKDGLEKFMSSNTSASRRYLEDSKNMLDDSKAKIALLRMQIEKISHQGQDTGSSNGSESKSRLDLKIDDLLFRLWKEAAIIEGAKNMIKILRAQRKADHKGLNDAQQTLILSEEKLELIFMALRKYM
ncbi:hypothetical protein Y032_0033g2629 [Ancylostoma ceylanicum]|uniref:REM-1 domain-containing protein n=1 Tax=Ancylostoma ceylanicum TaxID=53326 RepID=A0A016UPH8_9BILA|nr:hypothetical protein Y032_0033g2629 [Ancylostoma ceylanicum]